ncbi:MAG: NB-ARC domain-containing protein [Bryobacteraceae bacterium]
MQYLVGIESTIMPAVFSQIGSWPPAPSQIVGRDEDLGKLKALLTKNVEKLRPGVVRLYGSRLKEARGLLTKKDGIPATVEDLAAGANLGVDVIRKAERGEPIWLGTAARIAKALGKSLEDLTAPAGESIALQTLVTVHGLPGVGKTTTAARLAHDPELRRSFEGCLWVSLGQSPDSLAELKAWGRTLGLDIDREKDAKYARARLTAFLGQQRLLIIIDDVWTPEPAFDLMVGGACCATLVTTRVPEVANAIAPSEQDIYHLKVLSEDNSVALLKELALSVVALHPVESQELAKELECLPLALQVAGRLLREEQRKGPDGLGVTQLLRHLRDPANLLDKDAPGGPKIGALLKKSINVLDPKAQMCFAFLAPCVEKPATFNQQALNALWLGIANDPKQMTNLFISRGLLEPVGAGRFWLHALLVAYARSLNADRGSKSKIS